MAVEQRRSNNGARSSLQGRGAAQSIPDAPTGPHAQTIERIQLLKEQRGAIILAHNYMTPDIFHGVADITGDSLALAREAAGTEAELILVAGVHFMAETAKLLNPGRMVLIPDPRAGCSLASSITPADVRLLRREHPGVPIVTYVNTSAAVKAESDICCTSANAVDIVESLGVERAILLPDEFLAKYVALNTDVEIIPWRGRCEVHERFAAEDLVKHRRQHPDLQIVAHPECPPDVISVADYTGSTSAMIRYVAESHPRSVMLATECSMTDNVAPDYPETAFARPSFVCPHMKLITLEKILVSLETCRHVVEIPDRVADAARRSVEAMLNAAKQPVGAPR